jgi:hypothetical protein
MRKPHLDEFPGGDDLGYFAQASAGSNPAASRESPVCDLRSSMAEHVPKLLLPRQEKCAKGGSTVKRICWLQTTSSQLEPLVETNPVIDPARRKVVP